jgi:glycosyltransferase involved in cell wall biosynthesis
LRILFLAPQPFFEVRGTPLNVLAVVRALTRLGHEVQLLSFPQGEDVAVPGMVHHRSLRLPVGHVKAGPSLAKILLDIPFIAEAIGRLLFARPDVVHAVEEAAHLIAPFARLLRVPLVADVDSSIPDQLRYSGFATRGPLLALAEALETHALRHAAAALTVCQSLSDGVRRRSPTTPIFQIEDPPLVDPNQPLDRGEGRALRTELSLGDGPVALYTGNFESYQGVHLLVDAAALCPDVTFLFVGGGPRDIERMRARVPEGARCVFAGKRPPSDLPRFLAAADVVTSPRCQGDNTPFKLYTYLASGRPLVATRISTHTQLLDDALAFLVEPTAAGLAGGIREVLRDSAEAGTRSERGRALVKREYGPERFQEKIGELYTEVSRRRTNAA